MLSFAKNNPAIVLFILALPFFAALILLMAYQPANCDIGWLVYATQEWLAGHILYRDIFEVNPPWVFYLMAPPIYTAHVLGFDAIIAYRFYIGIIAMLTIYGSAYLFYRQLSLHSPKKQWMAVFWLIVLGLLYGFMLPGNTNIYSQREHFFAVAILPYLMLAIPWRKACHFNFFVHALVAFVAAIGFCLKPHFYVLWLAVESFHLWRHRGIVWSRAIYSIGIPLFGFLYVCFVYVVHPEYFSELLPIALASYGEHRFPTSSIAGTILAALSPLLVLLLMTGGGIRSRHREYHRYGWIVCIAALLIAIAQFKGWAYTVLPLLGFSALYIGFIVLENGDRIITRHKKNAIVWMGINVVAAFSVIASIMFNRESWLFFASPLIFVPVVIFLWRYFVAIKYHHRIPSLLFGALITLGAILVVLYPVLKWASFFWLVLPWLYLFILATILAIMIFIFKDASQREKLVLCYHRPTRALVALTILIALGLYSKQAYQWSQDVYTSKVMQTLVGEVDKYPQVRRIYLFNIGIYPAFPLTNLVHKEWSGRFHQLWMVPAAYQDPSTCTFAKRGKEVMEWTISRMVQDFQVYPPDLVLIDQSPSQIFKTNEHFDFQKCFSMFPEFARWMDGYTQVNEIDVCDAAGKTYECKFSIWLRRG